MKISKFETAKYIVDNMDDIIQQYILDDDSKYDFIKGIKIEDTPQMMILVLMEVVKQNISKSKINSVKKITPSAIKLKRKILSIIEKTEEGITEPLILNKIKWANTEDLRNVLSELEIKGDIVKKEITPKRGASSVKYFIEKNNFFKLSND